MASVVLEHVAKRYGDNPPVISDIDLEIREHEFVVLVAPSGCGRAPCSAWSPGSRRSLGHHLHRGAVVNEVPPKDRDIAMVFRATRSTRTLSVRENLQFGLKIRGTAQPEIDRLVTSRRNPRPGTSLLDRPPKDMSGGQRQRVALGRAIGPQPSVFLFDEPLSNLDAKAARCRCGRRSRSCSTASRSPPSTSPTIRWRR